MRLLVLPAIALARSVAGTVRSTLFNLTTKGIVTSSSTANNHLLFTNF